MYLEFSKHKINIFPQSRKISRNSREGLVLRGDGEGDLRGRPPAPGGRPRHRPLGHAQRGHHVRPPGRAAALGHHETLLEW